MEVAFIIIFTIYLVFIACLMAGWHKAVAGGLPEGGRKNNFISVIIAVRNEEASIASLVQDLKDQFFSHFEVIFVNDQSEDATVRIVTQLIGDDDQFVIVDSAGQGKKKALAHGMALAKGNLIVTTDGDCRVGPDWLSSINQYFQNDRIKMTFGGVRIVEGTSILSSMQAIEFSSLIATGASTIALGFPTMCNGANLAVRKELIDEVGGFDDNFHVPSGDDEFILRKIFQRYPDGIQFMSAPEGVVSTIPQPGLDHFIQQRIRWAGKWRHHKSPGSKLVAVGILIFQLSFLLILPFALGGLVSPETLVMLVVLKVLAEYIFLRKAARFLKTRWSPLAFMLLQFLYPLYVVFIGILSHFQSFTWKGRRLKSIQSKVDTIADTD